MGMGGFSFFGRFGRGEERKGEMDGDEDGGVRLSCNRALQEEGHASFFPSQRMAASIRGERLNFFNIKKSPFHLYKKKSPYHDTKKVDYLYLYMQVSPPKDYLIRSTCTLYIWEKYIPS